MNGKLFNEWLEETRQLQIEAYGRDPGTLEGDERIEFIRWNVLAATAELVEMLDETGWKPWATSRHVNEDAAIGEAVDVLHFVANLLLAFRCSDAELDDRYVTKMDINRARMSSGKYDGVSGKCPTCRRALDDPTVRCVVRNDYVFCANTQTTTATGVPAP